jgi:hypothetical protein
VARAKKNNQNDLYEDYLDDEEYLQELERRLEEERLYEEALETAKTLPPETSPGASVEVPSNS